MPLSCAPRAGALQTGTGKTYTMEGAVMNGPERGIIPRAIEDVFINIENDAAPSRWAGGAGNHTTSRTAL